MSGDQLSSNSDSVLEIMNSKISEAISSPMRGESANSNNGASAATSGEYRRNSPTLASDKTARNCFLRQRYYREQTSPKKEEQSTLGVANQQQTGSNSGSSFTNITNYDSQQKTSGGSPTDSLSRPSSRSSVGERPSQSPISSEAYRYSPRGRLMAARQHMEGTSPYPSTSHQSPGTRVPIPSPHGGGGEGTYSRSNSGGSSTGRLDSVGESPRMSPQVKYMDPPESTAQMAGVGGSGGNYYMQRQLPQSNSSQGPYASKRHSHQGGSPDGKGENLHQNPSDASPTNAQMMGYGPPPSPRHLPSPQTSCSSQGYPGASSSLQQHPGHQASNQTTPTKSKLPEVRHEPASPRQPPSK